MKYLLVLQCSAVQILGLQPTMLPKEIINNIFQILHHLKNNCWPIILLLKDILSFFSYVSYQGLLDYVDVLIIKQ